MVRLVALCVVIVSTACGRIQFDELADAGPGPDDELCLTAVDEDLDGVIDEAGCVCLGTSCEPVVYDLGAGLEANVVRGTGDGTDVPQPGALGWAYLYHQQTPFGIYGPLTANQMDPGRYLPMERARDRAVCCPHAGWYSLVGGIAQGQRSQVSLARWADPAFVPAQADAVFLNVENSRQVVIEWRAPARGVADLELEVRTGTAPQNDMEWHVFVRHGGVSTERQFAYLSSNGLPDANGMIGMASSAVPVALGTRDLLEPGDALYLYVRIGDDDAFDSSVVRGTIRFYETR